LRFPETPLGFGAQCEGISLPWKSALKVPQPRLFILPSAPHARKPGLMLLQGDSGRPQLAFRFTAANVVLPESAWKRPVELDLARWCGTPG
jgi:hypothetical protein